MDKFAISQQVELYKAILSALGEGLKSTAPSISNKSMALIEVIKAKVEEKTNS